MNKKKWGVAIVILCILCIAGIRFYFVNRNLKLPSIQEFVKGSTVPYENDFTFSSEECISGYSVKVLDSEILPVKDFYQKYDIPITELGEDLLTKYYYTVTVSYSNDNNNSSTMTGVNLSNTSLIGTNYYMVIDSQIFSLINPDMPGIGFSLAPETSKKLILPYAVVPSAHTDYEGLREDVPKLQITEYPHRKLLEIE